MMRDEPLIFEVGPLTLALTDTPVSEMFLDVLRDGIQGDVEAVIPTPALIGTYHQLRNIYNYRREDAENLVTNLLDSHKMEWYSAVSEACVDDGLKHAKECSIDGWDGYYIYVTEQVGGTLLTIDRDIERSGRVSAINPMEKSDFEELNEYLKSEGLV